MAIGAVHSNLTRTQCDTIARDYLASGDTSLQGIMQDYERLRDGYVGNTASEMMDSARTLDEKWCKKSEGIALCGVTSLGAIGAPIMAVASFLVPPAAAVGTLVGAGVAAFSAIAASAVRDWKEDRATPHICDARRIQTCLVQIEMLEERREKEKADIAAAEQAAEKELRANLERLDQSQGAPTTLTMDEDTVHIGSLKLPRNSQPSAAPAS